MYRVGEYLLYGGHGICVIDEVTKKYFSGKEKLYYCLHPLSHPDLTLFFPVDGDHSKLKKMLTKEEAQALINVFKEPAKEWIEKNTERSQYFNSIIKSEDRREIAELLNMLMRRKIKLKQEEKKLPMQETKLLQDVSNIFYNELAISLSTSTDEISKRISEIVSATIK